MEFRSCNIYADEFLAPLLYAPPTFQSPSSPKVHLQEEGLYEELGTLEGQSRWQSDDWWKLQQDQEVLQGGSSHMPHPGMEQ